MSSLAPAFTHRLLLLTESFPPSVGGIQAYLSGLWAALPPSASFVIAPPDGGADAWDRQQLYRIERFSTRAFAVPRWRPVWQAARILVRRENIEAVVCGKTLFEGRAAMRLAAEFAIPFVVCTYGMEISRWLRGTKARLDLRRVLGSAVRIVVINERTKEQLRDLGVPDERMVKIYPGVAEGFFQTPGGLDTYRSQYGLAGKRVITTVGRLVRRKGVDVLLDALPAVLREVPRAHLLIVGEGPERAQLERRAAARGLVGAVTFLGAVPELSLRRALAVADVFCLFPRDDPEDPEGFGMVYLEAAAAGKTSVASRAGGVPEAVLDGVTGVLVPPEDAGATAGALVRVLNDGELRRRLAQAARARVEKEFHWAGRAFLFQGMMHTAIAEYHDARNR